MITLMAVALFLQEPPTLDDLVTGLSDESIAVREEAAAGIVKVGASAIPVLEARRATADADLARQIDRLLRKLKTGWFTDPLEAARAEVRQRLKDTHRGWNEAHSEVKGPGDLFTGRIFQFTYTKEMELASSQINFPVRFTVAVLSDERIRFLEGRCADLRELMGARRFKDLEAVSALATWWTSLLRTTKPYEALRRPAELPDRGPDVAAVKEGGFTARYGLDYRPFSGRSDVWKDAILHVDAEGRIQKIVWEMTTRSGQLVSTRTDE